MPNVTANSVRLQQTLNRALVDGKITRSETDELVAAHNAEDQSRGPIGSMGTKLALGVIASTHESKFEADAHKALLDTLGATRNQWGSYYSMPEGHYAGADIYNIFQTGAADGKLDATDVQKMLARFSRFTSSNSSDYHRQLAVSSLLESLVLANEDRFTPDALKNAKVKLGLPLGPTPEESEAKIKEDGKVTKTEIQQLIADVKAHTEQFQGAHADPKPILFNFRVSANALLSAPAKAALNAELGIDPNKISYKPFNSTLRAVFGGISANNRISLTEARHLIEMAKQGTGTTDTAVRDFKALLALHPSRIDAEGKKELQRFVDTMSPKQTDAKYWGDVKINGFDSLPSGESVVKTSISGGLPMEQLLQRVSRHGSELVTEFGMPMGALMVNGTFVNRTEVILSPLHDGKFELKLVGNAPPGPSRNTGGTMVMKGGTFTADELRKGVDVKFVGREIENR